MDGDGDGWTASVDCADADPEIHPEAAETCDGVDQDCDSVVDEGAPRGGSEACPAVSCAEAVAGAGLSGQGQFWVQGEAGPAFEALCSSSWDGGGWALAAVGSDDGQTTWTWNNRAYWTDGSTIFGDLQAPNLDLRNPAIYALPFTDLLFVHAPSGVWAAYGDIGDGSGAVTDFIAGLGGSICYGTQGGWPMTAGTLQVEGILCTTDVFFNAIDQDGKSTCSSHDDSFGPAWSAVNNVTCPLDDVGHFGFGNNKLYPTEESDATSHGFGQGFGAAIGVNTGVKGAGENYIQLWVR